MGSENMAECECGFRQGFTIGGSRSSFAEYSSFPFFCEKCGLVEVNITQKSLICPTCKSKDITPYGKPPVSLPSKYMMIEWMDYGAPRDGNLCPSCRKMTLRLGGASVLFD
jgi:hypothetical protein